MGSISGPRIEPGWYIEHPDAASTYWGDGNALDAGMAAIIDSNINWLVEQSARQLVVDIPSRAGALVPLNQVGETWVGFNGLPARAAPERDKPFPSEISWERPWATCYGPFVFVADRLVASDVGTTLREVVVQFDYVLDSSPSSEIWLYAAISPSDSPPSVAPPWAFERAIIDSGAGQHQRQLTLSVANAVSAYRDGQPLTGRANDDARVTAPWLVGYLWVAAVSVKLNPSDTPENWLYSVGAVEQR